MKQGNHVPFHDPSLENRVSGMYFQWYEAVLRVWILPVSPPALLLGGHNTPGLLLPLNLRHLIFKMGFILQSRLGR